MKAYYHIGHSGLQIIQNEPNVATIRDFSVDPAERNTGVGSLLMDQACRDADAEYVFLYLKPYPFGTYDIETETFYPPGLNFKQLCAFYRKFGFRFKRGSTEIMRRRPRTPK